jgi:hypothetical protein
VDQLPKLVAGYVARAGGDRKRWRPKKELYLILIVRAAESLGIAGRTLCHDERSHEGGLPARIAHDLLRLIARRMRRRLLMLNSVG